MILGTHNSMTYQSPKQWYLKPFKFLARCQSKDYKEQYEKYGVRWFDIRIYFDENDNIEYRHGFFRYNGDNFFDFLNYLNEQNETSYIRLVFEERSYTYKSNKREKYINLFKNLCAKVEEYYSKNICFNCGGSVYTKEVLYQFKSYSPAALELYSSVTSLFNNDNKILKVLDDWCPWIYAKLRNKKNYEIAKKQNAECFVMDFVNIK